MPPGATTDLKAAHHCPLSPVARWEPNPTWIVEPSEYRIELELPPNSAPLESLEVVVTQYRRTNHDEIRVSIMKDCERPKSLTFIKTRDFSFGILILCHVTHQIITFGLCISREEKLIHQKRRSLSRRTLRLGN